MIGLPTIFHESTAPFDKHILENHSQTNKHSWRDRLVSIFNREDDVIIQTKGCMTICLSCLRVHVTHIYHIMMQIVRTDKWTLAPDRTQRRMLRETVAIYRSYVQALIGVVWTHHREIVRAESSCAAVERFIHATSQNPSPTYRFFDRRFPKFPSYYRRAAIEAALGQVSSFVTRYDLWQSGQRRRRTAKPPTRTNEHGLNPPLYRGQCVKYDETLSLASIKVWNGTDWMWTDVRIRSTRHRHAVSTNKALSPTLLTDGKCMCLGVPFSSTVVFIPKKQIQRVCAIDLGINTTATASILTSDGTVVARHFFHRAADIDRRDKGLAQIRRKARQTTGAGVLSTGFCASQYRKAANRNREMARTLSRHIVTFAQVHGVQAIVFEQLHDFRPRGGRATSTLRQRFHGWLHRQLAQHVQARAEEAGLRMEYVHPAGTSKYAFDGSGVVRRHPTNRALATFSTGKQYNADLSASYNIGLVRAVLRGYWG